MKRILVIICFSLSWLVQSAAAQSAITIVRGQDFPPYHYVDSDGVEKGFVVDIIKAAGKQMNIAVAFRQYPWSRCLQMMEKGKADAMMNLFKTPKRKKFMYFSNNILAYETNQLFRRMHGSLTYDGKLSELSGVKMGAIRNYSYGPGFDNTRFDRLSFLETETELIRSLVNKRCDVIIGNAVVIKMLVKQMKVTNDVEPVFPIVSKEPLYIGFSKLKGHEKLSDAFSQALKRLKDTGVYNEILKRYDQL